MQLPHDYFCETGESVLLFDEQSTQCVCGNQLIYEAGWSAGTPYQTIRIKCPQCTPTFDTTKISCDVLGGWTGKPQPLVGGLTYRFALIGDCHKCWPQEEEVER